MKVKQEKNLQDVEYKLYQLDGSSVTHKGAYYICDNGYLFIFLFSKIKLLILLFELKVTINGNA